MFKNLTLSEIYNKESPFEGLLPGTGIVLIGRASIGPVMAPIKVNTIEDALMIFGVDSEISNAYLEAKASGAENIFLVRINGSNAIINVQDAFTLISLEAISNANMLQYEILTSGVDRYLTLFNPTTGYNSSYYLTDKTITQIVSEINIDAMTFQSPVYATESIEGSTSILIDEYFSKAQASGADPEITNVDPNRIIQILDELDAYPISQVGILCENFNTIHGESYFYQKIVEFTERKVKACMPCIVTIGIDDSLIEGNIIYAVADSFRNAIKLECPISEFINVIISRPTFYGFHPRYISNGVAGYCGLIDSTGYYEGTTNKRIYGAIQDTIPLTNDQKITLANYGYVLLNTGVYNAEQQVRVLKGVNLARGYNKVVDLDDPPNYTRYIPAPMSNIANVKLIQHIVYKLDDILQAQELSKISTLYARIDETLNSEKEYVKEYTIDISETYQGFTRTYVVGLEIIPVGELSNITLSMRTR